MVLLVKRVYLNDQISYGCFNKKTMTHFAGKADEDSNGVISSLTLPRSHRERSYDTVISSTSTSPQQDHAVIRDVTHRSLRHTSSVSAPDVNKVSEKSNILLIVFIDNV
jgi:hypothetical protein